ncbi:hypothetical protein CIB48_g11661 [Xylaria polymorpha]|nr:hypothetical protein CIB48_g11661 [Xylaria polymorpha]
MSRLPGRPDAKCRSHRFSRDRKGKEGRRRMQSLEVSGALVVEEEEEEEEEVHLKKIWKGPTIMLYHQQRPSREWLISALCATTRATRSTQASRTAPTEVAHCSTGMLQVPNKPPRKSSSAAYHSDPVGNAVEHPRLGTVVHESRPDDLESVAASLVDNDKIEMGSLGATPFVAVSSELRLHNGSTPRQVPRHYQIIEGPCTARQSIQRIHILELELIGNPERNLRDFVDTSSIMINAANTGPQTMARSSLRTAPGATTPT